MTEAKKKMLAAKLFHMVYPRENFYEQNFYKQLHWIKVAEEFAGDIKD